MILMIILGLIAILSAIGAFQGLKEKNLLAAGFSLVGAAVFGWFVIMTLIYSGYPEVIVH